MTRAARNDERHGGCCRAMCVCVCVGGGGRRRGGLGCEWLLLSLACSCCSVFERQRGCPCVPLTLLFTASLPQSPSSSVLQFYGKQVNKTKTSDEKQTNKQTDWWGAGCQPRVLSVRDRHETQCQKTSAWCRHTRAHQYTPHPLLTQRLYYLWSWCCDVSGSLWKCPPAFVRSAYRTELNVFI